MQISLNKLPDKEQGSLVAFYYHWKKNRNLVSAMEQYNLNSLSKNDSNGNNFKEDEDDSLVNNEENESLEENFDVN